jgi:hypothetical protein
MLDASESRLALAVTDVSSPGPWVLMAGPLGGPLEKFDDCYEYDVSDLVVAGDLVSYHSFCAPMVVRNLAAPGAPVVRQLPEASSEPRLAGRLVAYTTGSEQLAVLDVDSGAQLYSVPPPTSYIPTYDVQADGKLAVIDGADVDVTAKCAHVTWYSPQHQQAHRLPGCAISRRGIRIAHGRVMYAQRYGHGRARLVLAKLDGSRPRLIAPLGSAADAETANSAAGSFDFDGVRAAYTVPGCVTAPDPSTASTDETIIDDLRPHPPLTRAARSCPLHLRGKRFRVAPDRRVRIRVRCAHGCSGGLGLRRNGRRISPRYGVAFSIVGPRGAVRVRVRRGFFKRLRSHHALTVTANLRVNGRRGGKARRVKRTFDLIAPD